MGDGGVGARFRRRRGCRGGSGEGIARIEVHRRPAGSLPVVRLLVVIRVPVRRLISVSADVLLEDESPVGHGVSGRLRARPPGGRLPLLGVLVVILFVVGIAGPQRFGRGGDVVESCAHAAVDVFMVAVLGVDRLLQIGQVGEDAFGRICRFITVVRRFVHQFSQSEDAVHTVRIFGSLHGPWADRNLWMARQARARRVGLRCCLILLSTCEVIPSTRWRHFSHSV